MHSKKPHRLHNEVRVDVQGTWTNAKKPRAAGSLVLSISSIVLVVLYDDTSLSRASIRLG